MCLNVKIVLQISCNSAILNYRPIYNKFILIANSMKCEDFYNYLRLAYCVHINSASQFEDPSCIFHFIN